MKKPLYSRVRRKWMRSPVTKVKVSDKVYNRRQVKKELGKEITDEKD